VFITSSLILGFLAFELLFSVQPMKFLFMDFHLKLPAATQFLLDVSDLFASGGWVIFILLPLVLGFLIPRLTRGQKIRTPEDYARILNRLIATMIVGLSILAIIVVFHVAMGLPMTTLIEGISGNQSGR
jgi:type II secretory pathway component PulF